MDQKNSQTNSSSDGPEQVDSPPLEPQGLWYFDTGFWANLTPVIVDGVLYFGGGDDEIRAFDPASGQLLWHHPTNDEEDEVIAMDIAVSGKRVLAVDPDGVLLALDATTGEMCWSTKPAPGMFGPPTVCENVVFAGSNFGPFYALNASSSAIIWRHEPSIHGPTDRPVAIVNGVIYVGCGSVLLAIDQATGTNVWRFAASDHVVSRPAVAEGLVVFGSVDNHIYAIDCVSGTQRWSVRTSNWVISSPAIVDGVVYVGSFDCTIYALELMTGKERWRFTTRKGIASSPVVVDGVVYVGSNDHCLYALSAETGAELWRFEVDGAVGTPAVADGIVIFGSKDSYLYAVDAATVAHIR